MESNDLEPITDENWHEAATVLCKSAMFYETMLVKSLEILLHNDLRDEVEELMAPHVEEADLHQAVVKHWRHFVEISDGE
jgi:hypothetical protein